MTKEIYRFSFPGNASIEDIESTLLLAIMATESLHGEATVRLDLRHFLHKEQKKCIVDASTAVGGDFNRLLTGFLLREYGDRFSVERVDERELPPGDKGRNEHDARI